MLTLIPAAFETLKRGALHDKRVGTSLLWECLRVFHGVWLSLIALVCGQTTVPFTQVTALTEWSHVHAGSFS